MLKHLVFVVSLLLYGCDNSSISTTASAIKSEKLGTLSTPTTTEKTLVLNLESTRTHTNDVDGLGFDTYKVNVTEAHVREYCLENDLGAGHRFIIKDNKEKVLLDITQGCGSVDLTPGLYTHTLYNGSAGEGKSHTAFIYAKNPDNYLLGKSDALQTKIKNRTLNTKSFNVVNSQRKSVISFNKCEACNLGGIDLSHQAFDSTFGGNNLSPRMNEDYFTRMNTTETEFFATQNRDIDNYKTGNLNLQQANLNSANLSYSIFRDANFNGVDFQDANLSHAVFMNCSFLGASFDNVDMTQTVFIKPTFGDDNALITKIISQPAITRLFQHEKSSYFYEVIVAIDDNNRVVINDTENYRELPALPHGLRIVSSPTIVPNNFGGGYSIFVKASDGAIYEYHTKGRDYSGRRGYRLPKDGWTVIPQSKECKSNPDTTFKNFGGSSNSNELTNYVVCHDQNAKLYVWSRTFYNKPNNGYDSYLGEWKLRNYNIPKTNAEISINKFKKIAYIEDGYLRYGSYDRGYKNYKSIKGNYASNVDLRTESESVMALVKADGNIYVNFSGLDAIFYDYGIPENGAISAPAIGGIWVRNKAQNIVVLSGDGRLYIKKLGNTSAEWLPARSSAYNYSKPFVFINNNLTETYFQEADFSNLKFDTNTLKRTFFTKDVVLKSTHFDNMQLNGVVFDNLSSFEEVTFKSSILNKIEVKNNKNIVAADFTDSTIDDFIWTSNTSKCLSFNGVNFTSQNIISNNNAFEAVDSCAPVSFVKAKSVPVELVLQTSTQNILSGSVSAEPLHLYDFSSTSFSDSFYKLDFKNKDMSGAKFGAVDIASLAVDLKDIDASGSTWKDADLSFVQCDGCVFDNTTFDNSNLYQAKMNNSSFISSTWSETNATYAQFQNSILDFIQINSTSSITATSFNKSHFYKAKLEGLNFNKTHFSGATLNSSDLSNSNLSNSDFKNAQLVCTNLSNPIGDISYTSFYGAFLNGANFEKLAFSDSDLTDAKFDFSGNTIVISQDRTCVGSVKKPQTNSSTVCQDGLNPSQSCSLQ